MQINSVSSTNAVSDVQNTSASKRQSSIPPAMGAGPAATKNISQGGGLMGKLQQLLQQDPAKFKEIVTKMAADVKTAAGKATGDQASFLTKLADNLSQAASTGSMAPLQPKSGAGGAGGAHKHHHHAGGAEGGGAGGPMQAIVQSALDQVNQALGVSASSSTSSTATTPAATPATTP
jgi:hypothetical protein